MKKNIVILSGGSSDEAKVSKVTSTEIAKTLNKDKYREYIIDPNDYNSFVELIEEIKQINPIIVFNGLHGAEGEDGRIQSLLSLENIPFTGSDHRSSTIAMDKHISGIIASSLKIPIPDRIILQINKKWILPEKLKFPLIVKPNNSGSSVGITFVKGKIELDEAITLAFRYSNKVIVEEFIEGRELTVTILGEKALPVVEIKPKDGWYNYNNKYSKGKTIYEVPAKLDTKETFVIQDYALKVFNLFGCSVYGRVDFRYDGNNFYFLEVNTLPGMTPLSLTPMAAKEDGFNFERLIEEIIKISLQNY